MVQRDQLALTLVGTAALSASLPLFGWATQSQLLETFGIDGFAIWPLTALGHLSLAVAFGLAVVGRWQVARVLAVLPLAIAVGVIAEYVLDTRFGFDTLMFGDQVERIATRYPGRPGAYPVIAFVLLGSAVLLARRAEGLAAEMGSLLASIALCAGVYSTIMLFSIDRPFEPYRTVVAPLPSAIATIALSSAFLWWRNERGWVRLLRTARIGHPLLGLAIPVAIVLPALPLFLEHWIDRQGHRVMSGAILAAVLLNASIFGVLLFAIVRRLREQSAAQRDLTDAIDSAAIALARPDGTLLHWSGGCEELYGWPAGAALGQNKYTLLHAKVASDSSDVDPPLVVGEVELIEQRRDGSVIHVLERRRLLARPGEEPIIVLKMLDISERARMERELRLSEERLMLAAEVNAIGVFEWLVDTGVVEWSPGSEQRLGVPAGSLNSFGAWSRNVSAEDLAGVMAAVRAAVAEHKDRFFFKYSFCPPGEAPKMMEGTSRCFYNAKGDFVRTVGAIVDVTQRDAQEAEERLRSFIETVPDATIVVDDQGTIRSFSTAAEVTFGWSASDIIGRNVGMLMADPAAAQTQFLPDYIVAGNRKLIARARELIARRADGSFFPIELNVGEARIGGRRIFTGIVRDVSERLAGEKRLSELNAELAHVSRQSAMSELAADLAHELNQPLAATANFLAATRMLVEQGGEQDERVGHLIKLAEEQTWRSGEIIRRLRDFLAKREIEKRRESLDDVARSAAELVLYGAAQSDVEIAYEIAPDASQIFADRIQIQQVFVNLLRNSVEALRSMPLGHPRIIRVSSRLAEDPGMVEVALRDTGPGLPGNVHEQLYERFATTKSGTAMGIGLSITRRIIEAHGGRLKAGNSDGGGAVFCFTLPTVEELGDDA